MPTINKIKKVNNYKRHDKALIIYQNIYNTSAWRRLRQAYLQEHPLCEQCLKSDKVTAATEVHHVIPISYANDLLKMKDLGFNYNNLMSLCSDCHHQIHNKGQS